ncbi:hypothetical protein HDV00_003624 [Rhizophlyctis rosea]|nr:hypothetical protein HDV00_003624 [Rhizophlyctis rosea]
MRGLTLLFTLLPLLTPTLAATTLPPKCKAVLCPQLICSASQTSYIPPGECCNKCMPDCSLVRCAMPVCDGGVLEKPAGSCCYTCTYPQCAAVMCAAVWCPNGSYTPPGQCCPVCLPDTTTVATGTKYTTTTATKTFTKVTATFTKIVDPTPICPDVVCPDVSKCPAKDLVITAGICSCPRCASSTA